MTPFEETEAKTKQYVKAQWKLRQRERQFYRLEAYPGLLDALQATYDREDRKEDKS